MCCQYERRCIVMAESISKLMLRIGLNFDELNKDFIRVESTLKENMSRLGRENNSIDLKLKIDLASLDTTKDAVKALALQEEALTKKIENQKARVQLSNVAWKEAIERQGQHSKAAMNTARSVDQERLKLVLLEQELQKVTAEQQKLAAEQNKPQGLLQGYQNIKGNAAGKINELMTAFGGLSTASQSADGAITKSLELIDAIPQPIGKAVAALASMPLILRGVENSIINYTKAAVSSGDSVYVMSRGMQLSVAEMGKLSTVAKVTGIDVNEVNANLRRLSASFVKAGDGGNLMTKTLDKYDVKLTDTNGNLKKGIDLSLALANGLKKAQEEGKGAEFIAAVGGKFWSGDFVTYLEDLKDNIDSASKIVKNGLANPTLAHQVQGNMNAMDAQAAQLKASFASVFIPVANEIIPRVTERMGDLTKFLAENKDEIKEFGNAVANFFGKIEDGADMAFKSVKILHDVIKEWKKDKEQKEIEIKASFNLNAKDNFDKYKQIQESYQISNPTYFAPMLKTLDEVKKQTKEKVEEINKEIEKVGKVEKPEEVIGGGIAAALERESEKFTENLEAAKEYVNKTGKYTDELYQLQHDSYENQKYDVLKWQQDLLNAESTTEEQRVLIKRLSAEKIAKIEQERAGKIADIVEQEERKYRTALENEIADAEKTKEEWIKIGMDKAQAEELAQQRILKAKEEATKRAQDYIKDAADIEYSLNHTAYEKQLRDIEKWREEQLKRAETAEEVAAIIKNAAMKETEAFEREVDRIKGLTQTLEDEIFEMEHSQYEADKRRAMQKAQKFLDEGGDAALAQRYLQAKFAQLDEKASKGGDYIKSSTGGKNNQYFTEFNAAQPVQDMIGLFVDENKIRTQLNSRLAESTNKVIDAQNLLARSAQSTFDIIEGDKVTNSNPAAASAQEERIVEYLPDINQTLAELPNDIRNIIDGIESGNIYKDNQDVYHATNGYEADLSNYFTSMDNLGINNAAAFANLDAMTLRLQETLSTLQQNTNPQQTSQAITVSPNINIDLGGAYVFDDAMKQALAEDITRQVADGVTSAVQQATNSQSYSYAS